MSDEQASPQVELTPQILEVLIYPDDVLTSECEQILFDEFGPELDQLCLNMFATMKHNDGIGLAANQVGINKRIVVMSIPEDFVMVNPVIVETKGEIETEEGCLSVPNYYAKIKRFEEIQVVYQNMLGEHQSITAGGMQSVCIQHEIDHLNGNLFVDQLSQLKQMRAKAKSMRIKKLRKSNGK